jgi:predicted ArsR family transcriptional regulator
MAVPRSRPGLASLSTLDDPVRSRLYDFVSGNAAPVGRDEAAAAVGIGRALAVYHLDRLVEAGLLTASYRRPPGRSGPGAGRPAKVYSRSGREFAATVPPREYELAARLLAQAIESDHSGRSLTALYEAAARLGAELGKNGRAGAGAGAGVGAGAGAGAGTSQAMADGGMGHARDSASAERVVDAVLRERGFEPWHDEAGVVRLRNCPFRSLAERHPGVICGMNLALMEGLVAGATAAIPKDGPKDRSTAVPKTGPTAAPKTGPMGATPGAAGDAAEAASALRPALDPQPGMCCVAIGIHKP